MRERRRPIGAAAETPAGGPNAWDVYERKSEAAIACAIPAEATLPVGFGRFPRDPPWSRRTSSSRVEQLPGSQEDHGPTSQLGDALVGPAC